MIVKLLESKKLSVRMGAGTPELPAGMINLLHIPFNVSKITDEIKLLPRTEDNSNNIIKSMEQEFKDKYNSFISFIDMNKWFYFVYSVNEQGKIIEDSVIKGAIKKNKTISYKVKQDTQIIFLCIGKKENVNNVSKLIQEQKQNIKINNKNLLWLIYGAS